MALSLRLKSQPFPILCDLAHLGWDFGLRVQKEDPACVLSPHSHGQTLSKRCLLPSWIFCFYIFLPASCRERDAPIFSDAYPSAICYGILDSSSNHKFNLLIMRLIMNIISYMVTLEWSTMTYCKVKLLNYRQKIFLILFKKNTTQPIYKVINEHIHTYVHADQKKKSGRILSRSPSEVSSGTSLVAQWLRIHLPVQRNVGSILGWGTKIPHAVGWLRPDADK